MQSLTAKWFFEKAGIPSASFVFDDDLATELETVAKANVAGKIANYNDCTTLSQRLYNNWIQNTTKLQSFNL